MAKFGKNSLLQLSTIHEDLKRVLEEAIKSYNFSIICGHRGQIDQDSAYKKGKSQLRWPNSRHNSWPSEAIDIVPYPCNWKDFKSFREMASKVMEAAQRVGVEIEWGGNWKFVDMPHFQLKKKSA